MSVDDERSLVTILLNKPGDKYLVDVDPNWLQNTAYRQIFQAIMNVDNAGDADEFTKEVWNQANAESVYKVITLESLKKLRAIYITDAFINTFAMHIHRGYLQSMIKDCLQDSLRAPTPSNLKTVHDLIDELNDLDDFTDSGDITSTIDEIESEFDKVPQIDIQTFPKLDAVLGGGLYAGCLFTIGGTPGTGKTSFAVNVCYQIMQNNPKARIDYFTKEMNKREVVNRFYARDNGINSWKLRPAQVHNLRTPEKQLTRETGEKFKNTNLYVYSRFSYIDEIAKTIALNASKTEKGQYVAIVDYIGLFHVRGGLGINRVAEISEITGTLKGLTNRYEIPIIELSQFNRSYSKRDSKKPVLSDLRDSGSVEQDSNVVGLLYRPFEEQEDVIALDIAKNREGEQKQLYYVFNKGAMRFNETNITE